MYVAEWTEAGGWQGEMRPYGPLPLEPSAQVMLLQSQHYSIAVAGQVNTDVHAESTCFSMTHRPSKL